MLEDEVRDCLERYSSLLSNFEYIRDINWDNHNNKQLFDIIKLIRDDISVNGFYCPVRGKCIVVSKSEWDLLVSK